jgi:hypothetical protein
MGVIKWKKHGWMRKNVLLMGDANLIAQPSGRILSLGERNAQILIDFR